MHENGEVDEWAETELAWELAEVASLLIPDRERIDVYTAIGAGYSYTAINALLETIVGAGVRVPPALVARLADWLNAYAHHEDAPRLHEMLTAVRSVS